LNSLWTILAQLYSKYLKASDSLTEASGTAASGRDHVSDRPPLVFLHVWAIRMVSYPSQARPEDLQREHRGRSSPHLTCLRLNTKISASVLSSGDVRWNALACLAACLQLAGISPLSEFAFCHLIGSQKRSLSR
jgi:hypothetical protein